MAARARALSESALEWLRARWPVANHSMPLSSHMPPADPQRGSQKVAAYFDAVTEANFLIALANSVRADTQAHFRDGVQAESLEDDHKTDQDMRRRVAWIGDKNKGSQWQRVILACDCQTLPNTTLSRALTQLKMLQLTHAVTEYVAIQESHSVQVKPVDTDGLRIQLIYDVTFTCAGENRVIRFDLCFVVQNDGTVKEVKRVAVSVLENIALEH